MIHAYSNYTASQEAVVFGSEQAAQYLSTYVTLQEIKIIRSIYPGEGPNIGNTLVSPTPKATSKRWAMLQICTGSIN